MAINGKIRTINQSLDWLGCLDKRVAFEHHEQIARNALESIKEEFDEIVVCLTLLIEYEDHDEDKVSGAELWERLIVSSRAALAKARGER